MDASEICPRRINAKETLIRRKGNEFKFPFADGTAKLSRRDYEFQELHSKSGVHRKEWTSQTRISRRTWRVSPDRTQRWRGSPYRLLVDSRWLHLSPSQRTPNSTPCAERRNISYSTEIHWCDQNYASWFCERVVYRHGTILLIVRRRSGYFPRRCWHWRWSTGQSTGRVRKRRGKRRRETREGHTRRRNQQTIKHTSWMTWRWNEARTQTRWVARLEPCSVICMKLNVQTAWEKWRVKCICLHTPSVTVDRHQL